MQDLLIQSWKRRNKDQKLKEKGLIAVVAAMQASFMPFVVAAVVGCEKGLQQREKALFTPKTIPHISKPSKLYQASIWLVKCHK